MSDDAYMSFLDKANADLNSARAEKARRASVARTETVHMNVRVPTPLTSVDVYYVSETDEPFEPVTLRWEGATKGVWPDAGTFSFPFLSTLGLLRISHCIWSRTRKAANG
jgi:hypothetical protein